MPLLQISFVAYPLGRRVLVEYREALPVLCYDVEVEQLPYEPWTQRRCAVIIETPLYGFVPAVGLNIPDLERASE